MQHTFHTFYTHSAHSTLALHTLYLNTHVESLIRSVLIPKSNNAAGISTLSLDSSMQKLTRLKLHSLPTLFALISKNVIYYLVSTTLLYIIRRSYTVDQLHHAPTTLRSPYNCRRTIPCFYYLTSTMLYYAL